MRQPGSRIKKQKEEQKKTSGIAVLGAGGLGMAAAMIIDKKTEFRLVGIADKTGALYDRSGINIDLLGDNKKNNGTIGSIGISTEDSIGEMLKNAEDIDGLFLALPSLTDSFIPDVVARIAESGFHGAIVDVLKRSGSVLKIFDLHDRICSAGITYVTGTGATPGLMTAAAVLASQSFIEVLNVDIRFGVGVSNWDSYRATIREDIANMEGFDLKKAREMTCAEIKEELDRRKGILELINMDHADDVLLEKAGVVSGDKVRVGGIVDTRHPKKPVSTVMTLTGKTFDGFTSSHRFILGDETTMAANVAGPALGWMKAALQLYSRGIYGVFGSSEVMPAVVR